MDRETKKLTLPVSGRVVELKAYLIGREKRALTNVYLSGSDLSFNAESKDIAGVKPELLEKAENLLWETIIVSIDGKVPPEINIVDEVLNLRDKDYDAVVKAVNDVNIDRGFEEKKTD